MKKIVTLLVLAMLSMVSCKKEGAKDEASKADPTANTIKVFKNTTGNPSANSLQAQIVNTQYHFTLNYYGTFDANSNPDAVHTLTYRRDNNDTTVFINLDPVTKTVQSIFTEVSGVRQSIVFKHEYFPGNDTTVKWSVYNYNWATNTSTLMLQANMSRNSQMPTFYNSRRLTTIQDVFIGIGVGIGVAGVVYTVANAAVIAAAITAAAPAILVTVAATAAFIAATDLLSRAGAAEFDPYAGPPPPNTGINNPTNGNNPLPNLPPSKCGNSNIHFLAGQDSQGNVLVFDAGGSVGPYTYAVGNLNFQSSQVFGNLPAGSSKLIFVRDANGCISGKIIDFTVPHPYGTVVAGGNGRGSGLNQLGGGFGQPQYWQMRLRNNNIYINDCDNQRLLKWPIGAASATVIRTYSNSNLLSLVLGFYVDAADNIYISYYDRVEKNGIKIASIKNSYNDDVNKLYMYPRVDDSGNLYVYAHLDNVVYKFPPGSSTPIIVAGDRNNSDTINGIVSMEMDINNNLYVGDNGFCGNRTCGGDRIKKYTTGNPKGTIVFNNSPLFGFDVDKTGNIYSAFSTDDVRKYAPGSTYANGILVAAGNGKGSGLDQADYIMDVKLDASGKIYFWDYNNHRVMRW